MEKDAENVCITILPANNTDEVKNRRKFRKEEIKRKKKAKREEEFLINLRKPKDTKVVLADRVTAERLLEGFNSSSTCRAKHSLDYPIDSKDFPELSATFLSSNIKSKSCTFSVNSSKNAILKDILTSEKNIEEYKTAPCLQENESDSKLCSPNANSTSVTDISSGIPSVSNGQISFVGSFTSSRLHQESSEPRKNKTIKTKDPIVLNVCDLVVNKVQRKKNKLNMHNNKFRRGGENYYLSGNMLDSSNPSRRRGKHRENKRKKLTKLKFAIIKDRILKFRAGKAAKNGESVENENFDIKVEVDEYLSDLIKKKLEFRKKRINPENMGTIQKEPVVNGLNFKMQNESGDEKKSSVNENGKDEHSKGDNQTKKNKNINKRTVFRKYCENEHTEDLDLSVNELIERIVYLQDKTFARDPIKARAKRRFVTGFREVQKFLMLKKIKILIIAPDLEAHESVFNKVEELKRAATSENIPCIFALNRRKLGFVTKKFVSVSVFGILNCEGVENQVETVKVHLKHAQMTKLNSQRLIGCDGTTSEKVTDTLLKLISDE